MSALAASLLIGAAAGCGAPDTRYPATTAQRAGAAMAERSATRELDCDRVEIEPVLEPDRICAAYDGTECLRWRAPRAPGVELIARGCGRALRFYCGGCTGDLSYCVSEYEIGLVDCATY